MKLWDDDDDGDDESARKYVQPTQEDFESFLGHTNWEWEIVDIDDTYEIVYESPDFLPEKTDRVVRIFSTINERSGKARDKGSDAIRTVIWDKSIDRPVGGRTKTLRITTWRVNLLNKLKDIAQETSDYLEVCEECSSLMVIREGKYGEFYGCREYPDCTNTKNIED